MLPFSIKKISLSIAAAVVASLRGKENYSLCTIGNVLSTTIINRKIKNAPLLPLSNCLPL